MKTTSRRLILARAGWIREDAPRVVICAVAAFVVHLRHHHRKARRWLAGSALSSSCIRDRTLSAKGVLHKAPVVGCAGIPQESLQIFAPSRRLWWAISRTGV